MSKNFIKYFFIIKKMCKKVEVRILFSSLFLFGLFVTGSFTTHKIDNVKTASKNLILQNREYRKIIQENVKNHYKAFSKPEKHLIYNDKVFALQNQEVQIQW